MNSFVTKALLAAVAGFSIVYVASVVLRRMGL